MENLGGGRDNLLSVHKREVTSAAPNKDWAEMGPRCLLSFCRPIFLVGWWFFGGRWKEIGEFGHQGTPGVLRLIPKCAGLGWGAAFLP